MITIYSPKAGEIALRSEHLIDEKTFENYFNPEFKERIKNAAKDFGVDKYRIENDNKIYILSKTKEDIDGSNIMELISSTETCHKQFLDFISDLKEETPDKIKVTKKILKDIAESPANSTEIFIFFKDGTCGHIVMPVEQFTEILETWLKIHDNDQEK